MASKFVIKKDKSGQFRFNYKAGNGELLTTSEAYRTRAGCMNGIKSVQKLAADAKIVDETQ